MDIVAYLERIAYRGPLDVSPATLGRLQLAHLYAVPFENLSIHAGEPIVLDDAALFDKIVGRRRGGFCYELNGLFAAALRELGFPVTMLSASVAKAGGGFGPDFDHMTLLVELDRRWLVDVGFGDSFRQPLLVDERGEQAEGARAYRIDEDGADLTLMQREDGGEWRPEYRFTLEPHVYEDYDGMCRFHQTSPESHFTRKRVCTLATPEGRVTLSDRRLITTAATRDERDLVDEAEVAAVLADRFGIISHR